MSSSAVAHNKAKTSSTTVARLPSYDITVDAKDYADGIVSVLSRIRSQWDPKSLDVQLVPGKGLTNHIFQCSTGSSPDDVIAILVYGPGSQQFASRETMAQFIQHLSEHSVTGKVYCFFSNGYAYRFQPGRNLSPNDLKMEGIRQKVARRLAEMHHFSPGGSAESMHSPILYDIMSRLIAMIPETFHDAEKDQTFSDCTPGVQWFKDELERLMPQLAELKSEVVFCHNNLHPGNIIFNEDSGKVWFVDFEYTGYNYQAFDIGSHFAEIGAEGKEIDPARYPNERDQKMFIRFYLSHRKTLNNDNPYQIEEEVHTLYRHANKFALAAHLLWSAWAFMQEGRSDYDFDFLGYGIARLKEYLKRKDEFMYL